MSFDEPSPSNQPSRSVKALDGDRRRNGHSESNVAHKQRHDHISAIKVLEYAKKAFEDDALLDSLPLDAAGNQGAWHAWQAHRRGTKQEKSNGSSTFMGNATTKESKSSVSWNWDRVWADRVKKNISTSVSDSVLYGSTAASDAMVRIPSNVISDTRLTAMTKMNFHDLDDETIQSIKEQISLTR